ncbi:Asp-tRNA(Asn)/Glu-tRNA(Gln) amidotransferase subunit GatA [Sporolactobacillus sp. CQH2019]|uniref:Asp-tRNA(Asn)/Glu-tRNA(Gln) amidotransferase subunit GatA n=1 Tax=Sporolactobacillus sp. CQH2019 TaxID=3023512 RepID=UPI0023676A69|nr:Asp-tRNA(Asn)/Glu-tRNA(Gln) amidotransferase subunit GatA [Sporolactobacillus sp. CQH2019]MDD9149742.1 Asp-tRNA(Asn)/Glu-tRNA(Gln) amidotransferase subunit GatA [Sporolactobacillus sp. CQH2019]
MPLFEEGLVHLKKKIHSKEIKASDLIDEAFSRINEVDGKVKAFLTLNEEAAREEARTIDETAADEDTLLFGLPIGIKDNLVTKGLRTTCASHILENYDPLYDATVVEKVKAQKGIVIGKMNMDEFAMGSSTENSGFALTRNPWDLERVPGGSSGGSAASVAAGEVLFALGSDTGGSIRQPSAFCGVVGMKPTYGRVSRFGLVAFASSLDQVGPITRTVEDNAYLLEAIAGLDRHDSTSADIPVPHYSEALNGDIKGLRVAVPKEYLGEGIDETVKDRIKAAIRQLEKLGAVCEEVSLPHSKYAVPAYYVIASSEASANLARFDGVRYGVRAESNDLIDMYKKSRSEGFGDEVKRRIMLGTFALSSGYYDAYYKKAQQVRTLIKQDFEKVLENHDIIVGPATPTAAFKIGEKVDDPLTMYVNDLLTIPVNLAGVPAISLPCGLADGLPVGLQMIGRPFGEETLYKAAYAYEQTAGFQLTPAFKGANQ